MFNVLLDELPKEWNECPIDTDFRTGILLSQCLIDEELSSTERIYTAITLLFPDENIRPESIEDAMAAVQWFLNEWNHDNLSDKKKKKKDQVEIMDFDVDQWRIYAAFKKQYGLDLNTEEIHFWVFMGLLSNLEECNFTQVVSIRTKQITSKMSKEEKEFYKKGKETFKIRKKVEMPETEEEKEQSEAAIEEFNKLRCRH